MNAYEILGVPNLATQAEIDLAYEVKSHELRRKFDSAHNVRRFAELNAAYALLSNRSLRRKLDENLGEIPSFAEQPSGAQNLSRFSEDPQASESMVSQGSMTNCYNTYTQNNYMAAPQPHGQLDLFGMRDEWEMPLLMKLSLGVIGVTGFLSVTICLFICGAVLI